MQGLSQARHSYMHVTIPLDKTQEMYKRRAIQNVKGTNRGHRTF